MIAAIIFYFGSFIFTLIAAGILLFLMLSHEDIDEGMIEPMNLSDYITTYLRIEMLLQIVTGFACLVFGGWIFCLIYTPMTIYNL